MPFKLHSKGIRHIPRQRHRVTNWREYDTEVIAASYTKARGRQKGCDRIRRRRGPASRREIQASPSCFDGGKPKVATRIFVGRECFGLKVYFPSLRLPWRALAQPLRDRSKIGRSHFGCGIRAGCASRRRTRGSYADNAGLHGLRRRWS